MKGWGRFEAYLFYMLLVLAFGIFVYARVQAFEGWLLVPRRGSESVIVRPAAGFSLAPLQRKVTPEALLVDHLGTYRQFLDRDSHYDAVQLPIHVSHVAAGTPDFIAESMLDAPAVDFSLNAEQPHRIGNWQLRRAPEQPQPQRYTVLIARRVAYTPGQRVGMAAFAFGALGFGFARRTLARNAARSGD